MLPEVSVIIPTFNRASTIKRAVDSVLTQSFSDFELIVVDDGSTDRTEEILSDFSNKIKILKTQNRGVSAARNLGAEVSAGRFIAFLDSDDEWRPTKLEKQLELMNKKRLRICQTEERWIRNGKFVNKPARYKKREGDIFDLCLTHCAVTPSSVLLEKTLLFEYGGFDESFPLCEDYDLWLRMAPDLYFGLVDEELILKYGGLCDQLSATPAMDKFRIKALSNLLKSRKDLPLEKRSALIETLKAKVNIFAGGAEKRGDLEAASQARRLIPPEYAEDI